MIALMCATSWCMNVAIWFIALKYLKIEDNPIFIFSLIFLTVAKDVFHQAYGILKHEFFFKGSKAPLEWRWYVIYPTFKNKPITPTE